MVRLSPTLAVLNITHVGGWSFWIIYSVNSPYSRSITPYFIEKKNKFLTFQKETPPLSKYFNEISSPSYIKLSINNPHKDFKSVKRPLEVEKFK